MTHLDRFLRKGIQEILQQLITILNPIRILPNNPNHRRFRLRLIQIIQILAQDPDNALILVGVAPEDVLDDDDGFLDDVGDFRLHEGDEDGDAEVGGGVDFDGETADGADGFAHEIDVDF